jgi:hypothetical protein
MADSMKGFARQRFQKMFQGSQWIPCTWLHIHPHFLCEDFLGFLAVDKFYRS